MSTSTTDARAAREPDCTDPAHRRRALARARRCVTCRTGPSGPGEPRDDIRACLGCERRIGYYSCAPGYCRLCAHDPCWRSIGG